MQPKSTWRNTLNTTRSHPSCVNSRTARIHFSLFRNSQITTKSTIISAITLASCAIKNTSIGRIWRSTWWHTVIHLDDQWRVFKLDFGRISHVRPFCCALLARDVNVRSECGCRGSPCGCWWTSRVRRSMLSENVEKLSKNCYV